MTKRSRDVLAAALSAEPRARDSAPPATHSFVASFMAANSESIEARLAELEAKFGGDTYPTKLLDPTTIRRGARANRLEASFDANRDPSFASLKASIREAGRNAVAILVRPAGDEYEIIFGERRLRACQQLGLPVLATIAELTDEEAVLLQYRENTERKDICILERAVQVVSWFPEAAYGLRDNAAASVGLSASYLSHLRLIATLVPALTDAHPDPFSLNKRDAMALARLQRDEPETFAERLSEVAATPSLTGPEATRLLLSGAKAATPAPSAQSIRFSLPVQLPKAKREAFLRQLRALTESFGIDTTGLPK